MPKTVANLDALELPEQWRAARERDRQGALHGNDPAPERKAGRVLAAFVASGLVFVALPGTFLGVWNLLTIFGSRTSTGASTAWIQAHGQAQLFGWVGTFILGISLYVLPKFLGRVPKRFGLMWLVWALWTWGAGWHWWSGVTARVWRTGIPASASLELGAFFLAQYLLWFDRRDARLDSSSASASKSFPGDLASWLGVIGFSAFGVALLLNLGIAVYVALHSAAPVYPPMLDRTFLVITIWGFTIPTAWGYSTRFVTVFAGLAKPVHSVARWLAAAVVAIVLCALARQFLAADVLAFLAALGAVWGLRIFLPSVRAPKRAGIAVHFSAFVRIAYAWLLAGAALGVWSDLEPRLIGLGGASRHALTVGFIATLIFCVAPMILPPFLNGRELFSMKSMAASLWLLTLGCVLRVSSEAVAYSTGGFAWRVLPVSATLELAGVLIFVANLGLTMTQPVPAWFSPAGVSPSMPVYFYVTSFPKTHCVLAEAGLKTLARVQAKEVPRTLTLAEAAEADGADVENLLVILRSFFAARQPRRSNAQ